MQMIRGFIILKLLRAIAGILISGHGNPVPRYQEDVFDHDELDLMNSEWTELNEMLDLSACKLQYLHIGGQ
jgi:hypothetical protein